MNDLLHHIPKFLNRLRMRQKGVWALSALLFVLTSALLVALLAVIIESVAWFEPDVRVSLAHFILISGGVLFFALLVFVVALFIRHRWPSDARLAHEVWDRDEEIRDRVLDALDLARRDDPNSSKTLRAEALKQSDELARDRVISPYVDWIFLKRTARFAAMGSGLVVLALLLGGSSLLSGLNRLAHPYERFIRPGTTFLAMDVPDSLQIVQGDTLQIAVRATHSRPRGVELVVDEDAGAEQIVPMQTDSEDTMRYLANVTGLRRDVTLWARAGRKTASDSVHVTVIRRPRIARLNVRVQPPAYTGTDPVRLPEGVGDVVALPGSRVDVDMTASRALEHADLLIQRDGRDQVDTVALQVSERNVEGSFRLRAPGSWWLEFTSEDGIGEGELLVWSLSTVDDMYPRVQVHNPEDGGLIPDALIVPLAVSADDDYGISAMNLRYRVYSEMMSEDSVGEDQYSSVELPIEQVGPGQAIVAIRWSMQDLPLLPTDEVHYFVEAWDNDSWMGPKRTRSELRKLVFPSVEELFAMTEQSEQTVGDELSKAYEQAERTRQRLEETLTRLRSNPEELSWDEARSLQQSLDQQEKTLEQLQKASEAIEQMRQQAEQHDLMSKELLDKYKQLQQLIEEVATPEMRETMEKMRKAMEELDGEQMREAIEEMMADQEKLLENLDRNVAILEQLKAERQLDELAQRAENLAERQEQLTEQLENASPQEMDRLGREQESIQEQSQELAQQIEQASEEMSDLNPQVADTLNQISEEMQSSEFKQPMQQAQQNLQQGNRKKARENSQQSSMQMRKMASRMRRQQQQMVQQNQQQLAQDMNRLFDSVLVISRQQELLREKSSTLGVASPRYRELAADQEALINGLSAVDKAVAALMRKTFFVGAEIAGNIARARLFMNQAVEEYSQRRALDVTGSQTQTLAMLHRSLRSLNKAQQQMQSGGSGTGYQEMMQKLQEMTQQQQGINNQSGMPMPMPGGQQPGGVGLQQLAAQQRALAEQMAQMERESQSMEEMLGELDGLSKDMEEVADDLEDRNVKDRTKRLQRRIVQRLLDSQRSLQERDRSRQRQGQLAEDIRRQSPEDLPVDTEDEIRQRLLQALESDYARVWRETIRDYYRALERDRQVNEKLEE